MASKQVAKISTVARFDAVTTDSSNGPVLLPRLISNMWSENARLAAENYVSMNAGRMGLALMYAKRIKSEFRGTC